MSIPAAADPTGTAGAASLRVGFVPGVTLTKWRRIWSERFPRQPLVVVEIDPSGQRDALDNHLVDLCFVRLPVAAEGLHVIRLYDEVPVVVVPKDHPVAAFDEITRADLAGETILDGAESADSIDRVAWGAGVLCVPQSIARSHSRRDLVYRPITDAEPTTIALAWSADNPDPLIEEFIGIVRGRTVNSSRTAQARAAQAPVATAPSGGTGRRTASRRAGEKGTGRHRRGH